MWAFPAWWALAAPNWCARWWARTAALAGASSSTEKEVQIHNPDDSINAGIAFITEDRQKLGLMLHASVLENSTILGLREKIKGFL